MATDPPDKFAFSHSRGVGSRPEDPGTPAAKFMAAMTHPQRVLGLTEEQYEILLLQELQTRIEVLEALNDPTAYGLPDLLRPQAPAEDDVAFKARQDAEFKDFVENQLWFVKDSKRRQVKLNREMLAAMADLFYLRVRLAIWWKPRGGGGSLGAAILIWMWMVWQHRSVVDIAGCLLPDVPVWVRTRGWMPVEKVVVGDEVLSEDGKIRTVTRVTSKAWDGPVTRIYPVGFGPGHVLTSDHRLLALRGALTVDKRGHLFGRQDVEAWDRKTPEWVPVAELKPDEDVLVVPRPKEQGHLPPGPALSWGKNGLTKSRVTLEWTPELCRFVGYWLAEGSLYRSSGGRYVRFDMSTEDWWRQDLLDLIQTLFNRTPSYDEPGKGATKEARVVFGCQDLANWLERVFGSGAAGKRIPWDIVTGLPEDMLRELLSGYLRGDGSAKKDNRGGAAVTCYTVSEELASALYWMSLRLGMTPGVGRDTKVSERPGFKHALPGWTLCWGSDDAVALARVRDPHKPTKARVPRQLRKWVGKERVYVGISDLEHGAYRGPVWDLTVDGKPSFAIPQAVAHNSGDQAKNIYEYTTQFWKCFPVLQKDLLAGEPLVSQTLLRNGIYLKCVVPGTPILTSRGVRRIEDIVVGDLVLDGEGRFAPVTRVQERPHDGDVVQLCPTGSPLGVTTTADHRIKVVRLAATAREQIKRVHWHRWKALEEPVWVEAGDITINDVLVMPRAVRRPRENKVLELEDFRRGYRSVRIVQVNPEFYRLMGYWLADGSQSHRHVTFYFGREEREYIDDVRMLVATVLRRSACTPCSKDCALDTVHFSDMAFAEWLRRNCGSDNEKRLPLDLLLEATDAELEGLVCGYLRGDGYFSEVSGGGVTKQHVIAPTVSPHVAQTVFLAMQALGMLPALRWIPGGHCMFRGKTYPKQPQWIIQVSGCSGSYAARLAGFVPAQAKGQEGQHGTLDDRWFYRPVRKIIRRAYTGPVYDLTVDGDPSFSSAYALLHNCLANSEKAARGKHPPTLVCDEACQRERGSDTGFEAAVQTVMSEPSPVVLMLSTFHHPIGFFQEHWDHHEEKGYTRYKWNVFNTMQRCTRETDCLECTLTRKKRVLNKETGEMEEVWAGCNGQARTADGYQTFENVVMARDSNRGTLAFETEYEGERPDWQSKVIPDEYIELAKCHEMELEEPITLGVGVDWGLVGQTAIALVIPQREFLVVPQMWFMTGKLTSEVVTILEGIREEWGRDFQVVADASHPFNNLELMQAGFNVSPVPFKKWKRLMYGNLVTYFVRRRIKLPEWLAVMWGQLRELRRDKLGNIIKKNDHGPDALGCALLQFLFVERFPNDEPLPDGVPSDEDDEQAVMV